MGLGQGAHLGVARKPGRECGCHLVVITVDTASTRITTAEPNRSRNCSMLQAQIELPDPNHRVDQRRWCEQRMRPPALFFAETTVSFFPNGYRAKTQRFPCQHPAIPSKTIARFGTQVGRGSAALSRQPGWPLPAAGKTTTVRAPGFSAAPGPEKPRPARTSRRVPVHGTNTCRTTNAAVLGSAYPGPTASSLALAAGGGKSACGHCRHPQVDGLMAWWSNLSTTSYLQFMILSIIIIP